MDVDKKEIVEVLEKAREFYEVTFECTGGCDHGVGICECQDRENYQKLVALIEDLKR